MADLATPYVNRCRFCGNGLLRLYRCGCCGTVVAVCDECELIWRDLAAVSNDARCRADGAYPKCPVCETETAEWSILNRVEIQQLGLQQYARGDSV